MISKLLLASALSLGLATGAVAQTSSGGSSGQSGTSSGTTGSGTTGTDSGTTGSVSGGTSASGGTSSGTGQTISGECSDSTPNQNQRDINESASAPKTCN
jgi:hypothetical protein